MVARAVERDREIWTIQGRRYSVAVARCPRGHIVKPSRDYVCGFCREHVGACRCQLYLHVTGRVGDGRHKAPTRIGRTYRATFNPERLAP